MAPTCDLVVLVSTGVGVGDVVGGDVEDAGAVVVVVTVGAEVVRRGGWMGLGWLRRRFQSG